MIKVGQELTFLLLVVNGLVDGDGRSVGLRPLSHDWVSMDTRQEHYEK